MAEKKRTLPKGMVPIKKGETKFGKMGGKASAEKKKEFKNLSEAMKALLSLPVSSQNKQTLERLGIDGSYANNLTLLTVATFKKGLEGDVKAIELINKMTGLSEFEQEKMKLERERIKIEKEKLSWEREKQRVKDLLNDPNNEVENPLLTSILKQMEEAQSKMEVIDVDDEKQDVQEEVAQDDAAN